MAAWRTLGLACIWTASLFASAESVLAAPDLAVTILRMDGDGHAAISAGQAASVSIAVHNLRGDAEAREATLTVLVPQGLAVEKATPAPQRAEPGNEATRLVWDLGTVAAGAFPRLFELDLRAAPGLKKGPELRVTASVAAAGDVNDTNNRAALRLAVTDAAAYLVVRTSLDSVPFTVGPPVEFEIEVRNDGTVPAAACELTMTLPARVRLVSSTPQAEEGKAGIVLWEIGDLASGDSAKVKAALRLDIALSSAAHGQGGRQAAREFDFAATSSTPLADPEAAHLKIARYPEAAGSDVRVSLNAEGVENAAELPAGKDVTYDLLYGNYGNEPARKVTAVLNLPQGLRFVSATPPPASTATSARFPGGVVAWDLGDLGVGRSDILRAKVHVASVDEPRFVQATIAAAAGRDAGSTGKVAESWFGPPMSPVAVVAANLQAPAAAGLPFPRWIVAAAGALAVLVGAIVVAVWWRRRKSR